MAARRRTAREQIENRGQIIVTLESNEMNFDYDQLGVTFDSPADEILEAVQPAVLEETGINILEDELYTVRKAENSRNSYLFPKSPAGL